MPKFRTHINIVTKPDSNRVAQRKVCFTLATFSFHFTLPTNFKAKLFTVLN